MPSRFWKASGNALLPSSNTFSTAAGGAFTPASISGLDLWIEADPAKLYTDAGTTLVSADGQAVYQANDKSSAARNMTQPTLAERPLYKTDLTKPSLLFDGSNDFLATLGALSIVDGSGQCWVAVSAQLASTAGTQEIISVISDSTGYVCDLYLNTTVHMECVSTAFGVQEDTQGTLTTGTPFVAIGTMTTAAAEAFLDNVSGGTTALTGTRKTEVGNITVGSHASSNPFNGRLFGVCHGTGTLSSTDRGNLQAYLAGLHP